MGAAHGATDMNTGGDAELGEGSEGAVYTGMSIYSLESQTRRPRAETSHLAAAASTRERRLWGSSLRITDLDSVLINSMKYIFVLNKNYIPN